MHGYITRKAESAVEHALSRSPVGAILGPRQCGKSTLIRTFLANRAIDRVYLDLQDRADRNKLSEAHPLRIGATGKGLITAIIGPNGRERSPSWRLLTGKKKGGGTLAASRRPGIA